MCRQIYNGRHTPKGNKKKGREMNRLLCMAADLETIALPEHYCDINNVVGSLGQLMSPFKASKLNQARMAKQAMVILHKFNKKTNGRYRTHLNKWISHPKHNMNEKLEGSHILN